VSSPHGSIRYALDADVIIRLQKSEQMEALKAVGRLPVVVTDVVWDEVIGESEGRQSMRENEQLRELLHVIAGGPTEIHPQTPEALAFAQLDAPKFGAGERSMIAYALSHPDVTVVLIDKLALHRAIEELRGERVLSLHGWLRAMEPYGLGRRIAQAISSAFCKAYPQHRPPLWW
jgi:predicted nucleic acid-binding protein